MIDYKAILQPYDIIVVYNPRSLLHRLIYRVTEYKAGHVALCYGHGEIVQAQSTGIKIHALNKYTGKFVYVLRPRKELSHQQRQKMHEYIENSLDKKYAFLQLFMILIKYMFRLSQVPDVNKKAMICSEFVANCYVYANIELCREKICHEVAPADILNSDKLVCVFSGVIE